MEDAEIQCKTINIRLGKFTLMRIEFRSKDTPARKKSFAQYCYEYYAVTGLVPFIYEIVPPDYIVNELGISLFLGIGAFFFSIMAIIFGHILIFSKYPKIKKSAFFSFFNIFAFSVNIFHVGMMICLWFFLMMGEIGGK